MKDVYRFEGMPCFALSGVQQSMKPHATELDSLSKIDENYYRI